MTTAMDVNAAIKAKYSGPEWRVWFEVSEGTGSYSGRRADAIAMNIWPSKAYQVNVFEVKVSRADFKKEMSDLTKWKAVGKYADFFWLTCPFGLVSPQEVPEAWGLMELTKGGLRVKKQAPARADVSPLDRAFVASVLRSGVDLTDAEITRRVDERVTSEVSAIQQRADNRHMAEIERHKARADACEKWRKEFESLYGVGPNVARPAAEMAARLRLASMMDRGGLSRIASDARHLADQIDKICSTHG